MKFPLIVGILGILATPTAAQVTPNTIPMAGMANVSIFMPAPDAVDVEVAPTAVLNSYGIPHRPDVQKDPSEVRSWQMHEG